MIRRGTVIEKNKTNQSKEGALFQHVEHVGNVAARLFRNGPDQRDVVEEAVPVSSGFVMLGNFFAENFEDIER